MEQEDKAVNMINVTAAMDQVGSWLAGFAGVLGTYWRALEREKIPHRLAADLMRDYASQQVQKLIGQDSQPGDGKRPG